MKKVLFTLLVACVSVLSWAETPIVGDWKTVDDETGETMSIVTIYKGTDGMYYGKVAKVLKGSPDAVCTKCEGDDHNKPIQGLHIIRGMKLVDGELRGGTVLDPNNGKTYYAKMYLKDGKLVLRGSLDKRGLFGRNQTWLPAK